ncbi:MAG: ATP synthase subunit I, partial [Chloroflexota bacterium]
MADDKMLQEAIEAVATGQSDRARDLLTRLLRADQSNPRYWLWMSSVVDTTKERIYCLQKVIHLDPGNRAAQL